jgi:hypothetical protein
VGGGGFNLARGLASTVSGGSNNCAGGAYSWAGGLHAKVRPDNGVASACGIAAGNSGDADGDEGSFIWSDAQGFDFATTGPNQFAVRAAGGVRLHGTTSQYFGSSTRQMLNLFSETYGIGVQSSTLYFRTNSQVAWYRDGVHSGTAQDPGAGGVMLMRLDADGDLFAKSFQTTSDRHAKTAFAAVDPRDVLARVLALPVSEWSFIGAERERHIGPMAQDFHAAFGLGGDETRIATVDADGVALAAIQGLHATLTDENAALRTELDHLREALARQQAEISAIQAALQRQTSRAN